MNKLVLSVLALLMMSNSAISGGWSGRDKAVEIHPSPSSNGVLIVLASMPNPDNCTIGSYYILHKDNIFFKEIFSLLMSAQARNVAINVQVESCGGPGNNYPLINQVIAT